MTAPEEDDSASVAEALGVDLSLGSGVRRFASGSVPVFAVGEAYVIKLFPERQHAHFKTERAALTRLAGRLPVPTPQVVATGARGSFRYVVMTRLQGEPMAEAWPKIDSDGRHLLMREVGLALAALRTVPTEDLEPLAVNWPHFIAQQRATCPDRQLAKGLSAEWAAPIEDFLARWTPRDDGARVVLHTEIMREHLLVVSGDDGFHVSGLFDFEPAMVGAPEYELASIGVFVACAEPGLLRSLLEASGTTIDDALPQRIMAYGLLHRYSNLRWYLDRLGGEPGAVDLDSLARRWFSP